MKKIFHKSFEFLHWRLDVKTLQLSLSYQLDEIGVVREVFSFPQFDRNLSPERTDAINRVCELVHLMCGVSYYKAGLAKKIKFKNKLPSPAICQFIEKTWFHGLAEMAYENGISLKNHINLVEKNPDKSNDLSPLLAPLKLRDRALVPLGGGKDSLVTIEELKQQGKEMSLFMVGNSALIKDVASYIDLPLIQVTRKIDDKLIQYNNAGAFNGHVPITAINSCIAVLCALLFDYDSVVFSNERSADSANTINADGDTVNHQYTKSHEFEKDFCKILATEISPELKYSSLQRPYSELAILKKFADYPQYFSIFSSCNRNFHIDGSRNDHGRWCGDCPKCRFVFLGLAAFIKKQQLLDIFHKNMLNDICQKQGFAELLGIKGFKPFECVGELQESQLAFNLINNRPEWKNDYIIQYFKDSCPVITDKQSQDIMQPLYKL
ncbi:MAG: hypothetical protein JKY19_07515 [Alcanivoracaceae bacterium]|nr:hypothetical protein [Alcanivoracaceae bacterium]